MSIRPTGTAREWQKRFHDTAQLAWSCGWKLERIARALGYAKVGEVAEAILRPRYIGGAWRRERLVKLELELQGGHARPTLVADHTAAPQQMPTTGPFREAAANVIGEALHEIVARSPKVRIDAIALDANQIIRQHQQRLGLLLPLRAAEEKKYIQAWQHGLMNELRQLGMLQSGSRGKLRFAARFYHQWRIALSTNAVMRWMLDLHNTVNRESRERSQDRG